ncbi:MAG TPA: efflux RND transporter periplasmic adaptor subunit [Noviherbaspirillum sp.]
MQTNKKAIATTFIVLALLAAAYFASTRRSVPERAPVRDAAQLVRTVIATQKPVDITLRANGYVAALNAVEVRPQVQNVVRKVHVREGQDVKSGDLLFTLDQRAGESEVARARAELASARAELGDAEAALKRNLELASKGFVSQAVVDAARNKVEALRGTVRANEAAIETSAVALGNNRITATISGRIGAINVRPGSLAQPGGEPMLTIAQLDPITVSFSLPERQLAAINATYPDGNAPITARLPGGHQVSGRLYFIDNAADPQSGTIRMKAQFPNAERRLWPGTFVTVEMVSRTLQDAVVIPAQAVVTGPTEKFAYLVEPDNTVRQQSVEILWIDNGMAAVTGLAPGARVVMEGSQNLRPGSSIREAGGDMNPAQNSGNGARPAAGA